MTSPNFAALLSKPADQVEKPKPLPQGTYTFQVLKYGYGQTTGEKKTDFVEFTCGVSAAGADIDPTELEAAGGITRADGSMKTQDLTFYVTEAALYRLTEFLIEHLGITETGASTQQLIEEHAVGKFFTGNIKHVPKKGDASVVYANIDKTAAA